MSGRRLIINVTAVAVFVAIGGYGYLAASAQSKAGNKRGGPRSKPLASAVQGTTGLVPDPVRLAELSGLNDPANRYTVVPVPKRGDSRPRTAEEDKLFQDAATVMANARPVPAERIEFFRWVERDEPMQIYGWSAFVVDVAPIPGGWAVTMRVWPKVTTLDGGGIQVFNFHVEEYALIDGVPNFVRGGGDRRFQGHHFGR